MKKLFFLFLFSGLFLWANAQFRVAIRPQVGINVSSLKNISADNISNLVGFQFGADVQLGGRFYVQPGILYEFINNTAEPVGGGEEIEIDQNRLRIPVLVGFKILPDDADRWFNVRVFTGPNAAFVTSKPDGDENLEWVPDDWKNFVWGWNAGAGVDLAFIFLDLGYEFGLSEVIKDLDESPRNNLFYANAGVRIRF